jgi:hypothetical protein
MAGQQTDAPTQFDLNFCGQGNDFVALEPIDGESVRVPNEPGAGA